MPEVYRSREISFGGLVFSGVHPAMDSGEQSFITDLKKGGFDDFFKIICFAITTLTDFDYSFLFKRNWTYTTKV